MTWEVPQDWGWLPGEPQVIRGLGLCPYPYLQGGERGWRLISITNGQGFNQSCLRNDSSTQPQKDGVQRASGLGSTQRCGDRGCPQRAWKRPALSPFPAPCPVWLLVRVLSNKGVNVSPSSMSRSGKLMEPREGVPGTSHLEPVTPKHKWDLSMASEAEQCRRTWPLTCGSGVLSREGVRTGRTAQRRGERIPDGAVAGRQGLAKDGCRSHKGRRPAPWVWGARGVFSWGREVSSLPFAFDDSASLPLSNPTCPPGLRSGAFPHSL